MNEEQWKTIPLQEYNYLVHSVSRMQELQDTINRMAKFIESKENSNNNKYIDVSSLKTVCFGRKIHFVL